MLLLFSVLLFQIRALNSLKTNLLEQNLVYIFYFLWHFDKIGHDLISALWSELHHGLVQDSREPVFLNQIESDSVPPFMTTAFNIIKMTSFLVIFHNFAVLGSLSILNNATYFPYISCINFG